MWKGSFSVEIDSELCVDCFTSLERVGGGSFVGKPVKHFDSFCVASFAIFWG